MKRAFICLALLFAGRVALLAQPDPATVYAWFKADTGVITNASGTVTNWQNQATTGTPANRNLAQYSGTPTRPAGIGPNAAGPAVRFVGAGGFIQYLRATDALFGTLSSNRTIVAYIKLVGIPTGGGFLFDGYSSAGLTRVQTDDTKWQVGLSPSGINYNPRTLTFQTGVWQVHTFSFNRTNSSTIITHAIAGGGSFTYTTNVTYGLAGLILGQPNSPSSYYGLSVDFAELLVYDRLLDGAEQGNVVTYLTNKWSLPAPALTGVAPTNGFTTGGDTVTLTGSNFVSGATVKFGATAAASVTFSNSTTLRATTPAGVAGPVEVIVTNPDAQSATNAGAFTYTAPPVQLTAYAWFKADVGTVTNASGAITNWQNQALTGTPSARNLNLGLALALVPAAVGTNPVIRCTGANNLFAASSSFGSITTSRTIVTCVKLSGTNGGFLFDGSTGSGLNRAQIRSGSWQVGAQPSGIGNAPNADPATLPIVPAVWQVHSFGFEPVTGGTRVTHSILNGASYTYTNANMTGLGGIIIGQNGQQALGLAADLAELFVFDRTLATNEQQVLSDYLTAKWQLAALPPPAITGASPTNGPATGGTLVTVSGNNFLSGVTVKFGTNAATSVIFSNATTLTAVTPGSATGLVSVTVQNPDAQSATATNVFRYDLAPAPVVSSIAPTNGSTLGGTVVTVTGSNFVSGITVAFGVTPGTVTGTTSTQITVTTPALTAGTVDVRVTNPDAQLSVLSNAFTVVAPAVAPPAAANLYAWYAGDSSLTVGADNYSVTAWNNLGSAATNSTYTQIGRNLTRLTGVPQKVYLRLADGSAAGAVRFDGAQGVWAAKGDFGILTNNRSLVAYTRISNSIPVGFLFDSTSTAPGYTRALVTNGNWQVSASSSAGTITAVANSNVWQVHTFIVSTNSGTAQFLHYINGAQVGNVALGAASAAGYLSGLMIGANVSAVSGIRADVAEFMVFTSALDDATRTNVENYLATKWAGVTADSNPPAQPTNVITFVPVFTAGVGYTCYRIPALVTTTNGTLIAVSDGRIGSCGDIPTPLDLVCKRSFDGGATWGPLQVIADYGSNGSDVDTYPAYGMTNISRVSSGDAALLLDRSNGRVWVFYDNGGVLSGARKIKLEMRYSDDAGATWSSALDIEALNPGIRPSGGEFIVGPGNGIQMVEGPHAGRLIFPVYHYQTPASSMVIYSDDHGATWTRGAAAGTGGGESQVAETGGGSLIISMRDNNFSTSGLRTFARSTDGGETWGTPFTATVPTIPDPACQGNIYRLTTTNNSNASRLIHANANSSSGRVNMTIRLSYDEGATWPVTRQIYSGGSAYSSVTKLDNGDVGLLFEKDPYGGLTYVRQSVWDITAGADYTGWPPHLDAISPTNGPVAGGTLVTLTGTNFAPGIAISFGGVAATTVNYSNSTLVTAVAPTNAAGPVDVRVANLDGQSSTLTNAFTFVPPFVAPNATNVFAWFKGDAGITGWAAVGNWPNQSASITNPAVRDLSSISGTPMGLAVVTPGGDFTAVRFDGLAATWATSGNFGALASNRTVVAYCRLTSANGGFLFDGSTTSGQTRAQVRSGNWQVGLQPSGGAANADTVTLPAATNVWQAHVFAFDRLASSTRVTHTIAGVGSFAYTNSQTVALGGLIVGKNVSAALGLPVDVAEFIVYDRALDAVERQNVTDYLAAKWGAATDAPPNPMSFSSCTAVQTSRTVANFGLHYLLDAQIVVAGQTNPIALTNLTFTLAGSTDAAADVAAVSVWFTGGTNLFRPITQFGAATSPFAGTISVSGSQLLSAGTNHIWIAVEPKRGTPWGHALDAELVSVGVTGTNGGSKTPTVSAPPEFLTLGNVPFYTTVVRNSDDGVFQYRIPGLAVTTNGTLIATFDLRDANADLPASINVGCKRSTDLGNTWGPTITIMDFDKNVASSSGNGVGDAALLVDRQTGTIWVAALWSFGSHSIAGSLTGTETNRTGQYMLARSDDDGLTWSAPINITVQAKANTNWGCTFQGPGKGIQLRNGALVFPSQHTQPGGGQGKVYFIYSTDHGNTWQVSPDVTTNATPTMNESEIVELNSGQLLVSMRMSSDVGGYRGWSTYTPGTAMSNGTWSPLLLNLPDPRCQATAVRYSSTLDGAPRDRMLFSNPSNSAPTGYATRLRQTVYMSEDEGATWPVSRQIDVAAGYSCMTTLPDGTVGIFYEDSVNSFLNTTFARFSLDWLTQSDVDSDGDGMSDYYEGINGLTNGVNDAALDSDGDGMTNLQEFFAGTMANDAGSRLRVQSFVAGGGGFTVSWTSVVGHSYAVQQTVSLSSSEWTAYPGAEAIPAVSATSSYTLPLGTNSSRFFRVKVLPNH